jgi:Uma2 family endonuclease
MPRPTTRLTEEEFLALPRGADRLELLDGELVLLGPDLDGTAPVVSALAGILGDWVVWRPPGVVLLAPLEIRVSPGRIVQPDLTVFLRGISGAGRPLAALPDLVVEVMSARRSHDRIVKRQIYAEAGVPEYWLVDLEERCFEVYRGAQLIGTVRDKLISPILPELRIDLAGVLAAAG